MRGAGPRRNPFANLAQALAEAMVAKPPKLPTLWKEEETVSALQDQAFNEAAKEEEGLRLLLLLGIPDGKIFRGWQRYDSPHGLEEIAASVTESVLAMRRVMLSIGGLPDELWTVMESPGILLLVCPIRLDFAVSALFGEPANQGSARVSVRRLIKLIEPALPAPEVDLSWETGDFLSVVVG